MSRKVRKIERRLVLPDNKYHSVYVSKFINYLMQEGKKSTAEEIFYSAMHDLVEYIVTNKHQDYQAHLVKAHESEEKSELVNFVFLDILNRLRPMARLKSKRIGGANYQVPIEISKDTSLKIAMKALIAVARKKSGKPMAKRLFGEFLNVINKEGDAVKQKLEMEKRIESSRAFAHYV